MYAVDVGISTPIFLRAVAKKYTHVSLAFPPCNLTASFITASWFSVDDK